MSGKLHTQSRCSGPLRIGFVPVCDSAPLALAQERGLFAKYGLEVELHREGSWTQIRDKVVYGELDAAHAPGALPFVANLCLDSDQRACITGLILSLQGNSITLSSGLWAEGVRDAASLRTFIFRHWGRKTCTLGVSFPHSSHVFILREWLKSGGIDPDVEVRVVSMPPSQLFPALKLGYVDGYCLGEPWSTIAESAGIGRRVASSEQLAPYHPEKVLMVTRDFAERRSDEHERLITALIEACAACDQPASLEELCAILSQRQYVGAPPEDIRGGLTSPSSAHVPIHSIFHRCNANEPTDGKASWIMDHLYELLDREILRMPTCSRVAALKNVFRRDIYHRARARVNPDATLIDLTGRRGPENSDPVGTAA